MKKKKSNSVSTESFLKCGKQARGEHESIRIHYLNEEITK